jgi:hypothetical protein
VGGHWLTAPPGPAASLTRGSIFISMRFEMLNASCSSYHHHFFLVVLFSANSASHLSRTVQSSRLPQTRAKAVALIAPCLARTPLAGGRQTQQVIRGPAARFQVYAADYAPDTQLTLN